MDGVITPSLQEKVLMKKLLAVTWTLAVLAGCSSEPAKPAQTEKPKPPEAVTGRVAFQKLYIAARGWARDTQPFRLQSIVTSDANGKDGKSFVWRAGFASATQRSVKAYVWSEAAGPDAPARGINPGPEDTYSPTNSSTHVFEMAFLKIDSDKALAVAQEHGGDKVLQKNPDLPIVYVLDWYSPTNKLIWHVFYGGDSNSKLRVEVDATSGDFIRVEK
jgi:hypothetical protein